jgi:Skp family chaperone for outer membrane proteins
MIAFFSGFRAAGILRRRAAAFALALLVGAPALAVLAPGVRAQQQQINVAVLGVQEIMRESSASKIVLGEIQKREGALKAEVEKRENALLAADQQLAQQRGTLSAEEFAQKRNEIAQQAAEVRKYAQAQQAAIADLAHKGEAQIRTVLLKIVEGIAKEKSIRLVLNKAQVVLFPNELDITDEAMKQLNAQLPTVNLAN